MPGVGCALNPTAIMETTHLQDRVVCSTSEFWLLWPEPVATFCESTSSTMESDASTRRRVTQKNQQDCSYLRGSARAAMAGSLVGLAVEA